MSAVDQVSPSERRDALKQLGVFHGFARFISSLDATGLAHVDEVARSLRSAPRARPLLVAFDRAFRRLDAARGSNNHVTLAALRAALPDVPRETFDRELNELRRMRRYTLSEHLGAHLPPLSATDLAAAIVDPGLEGRPLVYVARTYESQVRS